MATQNQQLPPGQWVQLKNTTLSPPPVGIIRQSFMAQGDPYYQVTWFPGSRFPQTSQYHEDDLQPMTAQQASTATQAYNVSQGNVAQAPYPVGYTKLWRNWKQPA